MKNTPNAPTPAQVRTQRARLQHESEGRLALPVWLPEPQQSAVSAAQAHARLRLLRHSPHTLSTSMGPTAPIRWDDEPAQLERLRVYDALLLPGPSVLLFAASGLPVAWIAAALDGAGHAGWTGTHWLWRGSPDSDPALMLLPAAADQLGATGHLPHPSVAVGAWLWGPPLRDRWLPPTHHLSGRKTRRLAAAQDGILHRLAYWRAADALRPDEPGDWLPTARHATWTAMQALTALTGVRAEDFRHPHRFRQPQTPAVLDANRMWLMGARYGRPWKDPRTQALAAELDHIINRARPLPSPSFALPQARHLCDWTAAPTILHRIRWRALALAGGPGPDCTALELRLARDVGRVFIARTHHEAQTVLPAVRAWRTVLHRYDATDPTTPTWIPRSQIWHQTVTRLIRCGTRPVNRANPTTSHPDLSDLNFQLALLGDEVLGFAVRTS